MLCAVGKLTNVFNSECQKVCVILYVIHCLCSFFCQPAKPRSRSWNQSQDNKALQQASMWRKGYVPGLTNTPSISTSVREKLSPTKGKERVVSVKGLKLSLKEPQVKRPRQGKFTQNVQLKQN